MPIVVFRKQSSGSAPSISGVTYRAVASFEDLQVKLDSFSIDTSICFGLEDDLKDFLEVDSTTFDEQKVLTIKSILDNQTINASKLIVGTLSGCNHTLIPTGIGTFDSTSLVSINCQLVNSLVVKDSSLTLTKLQQWLNQIRVSGPISPSTLTSPPEFIQPTPSPSGDGTTTYRFLAPGTGIKLDFDLSVFANSRTLSDIQLAEDKDYASITGDRLYVDLQPTNLFGVTIGIFTNEPTLGNANKKKNLVLKPAYLESVSLVDSVTQQPVTDNVIRPGVIGKRIVPVLDIMGGSKLYNLTSSSDRALLQEHYFKLPSPLFTFSTEGQNLQVDSDGFITVPPNNILPTGPFTKVFSVTGPGQSFVVEPSLTVDLDTLVVTLSSGLPAQRGIDYLIVDNYPLTLAAPTVFANGFSPHQLNLSYHVIRTLAQYVSASEPQSIKLDLNFKYAGWDPSTSTVLRVQPNPGWYKVFDGLGGVGLDLSQLLNTLGTVNGVLTGIGGGLQSLLKATEILKAFVPIFGLFELKSLPSALSLLVGPITDQIISILNTGLYWVYFYPNADHPPPPVAAELGTAPANTDSVSSAPAGGALTGTAPNPSTTEAKAPAPTQVPKQYTAEHVTAFNNKMADFAKYSYWVEYIRVAGQGSYVVPEAQKSPLALVDEFVGLLKSKGLALYSKSTLVSSSSSSTSVTPTNAAGTLSQSIDVLAKATKQAQARKSSQPSAKPVAAAKVSASAPSAPSVTKQTAYLAKSTQLPSGVSAPYSDINKKLNEVYVSLRTLLQNQKLTLDTYYWAAAPNPSDNPTNILPSNFSLNLAARQQILGN